MEMVNSKELDFHHELGNINEAEAAAEVSDDDDEAMMAEFLDKKGGGKAGGEQIVFGVDGETLSQNV
jgi:hypothetical protein